MGKSMAFTVTRAVGGLCLFVSLFSFGFGLYLYRDTRTFVRKAVQTQAVVARMEESISNNVTSYHPVLAFTDASGRGHEFRSAAGSSPSRYATGQTITIVYDPANPGDARIDSFLELWAGPVIGTVMGVIPLVLRWFSFKGAMQCRSSSCASGWWSAWSRTRLT